MFIIIIFILKFWLEDKPNLNIFPGQWDVLWALGTVPAVSVAKMDLLMALTPHLSLSDSPFPGLCIAAPGNSFSYCNQSIWILKFAYNPSRLCITSKTKLYWEKIWMKKVTVLTL